MTYEEAIEEILWVEQYGFIPDNSIIGTSRIKSAFQAAIEALEKQMPHKPVGRHTDYRCSVCGTRVRSGQGSSSRTKDTVCRKCYTVIDWSDAK